MHKKGGSISDFISFGTALGGACLLRYAEASNMGKLIACLKCSRHIHVALEQA